MKSFPAFWIARGYMPVAVLLRLLKHRSLTLRFPSGFIAPVSLDATQSGVNWPLN